MKKITPPARLVRETLALCTERIEDPDFKTRADSLGDQLESEEIGYGQLATRSQLYRIQGTDGVGPLTKDEMVSLYDQRLSKKGHPAREIYDSLRAGAKFNICPLCGHRPVASLDHYLAKSSHPRFAITPLNLVPSCSDCNKAKLAKNAATEEAQTLHPYFDDFNDNTWLWAHVIETEPPAILFFTQGPATWLDVKKERVATHFEQLGLAELYGSNAAQELAQISTMLNDLANNVGPNGVREHLVAQWRSRAAVEINSWQTAMYAALATSVWFCNGGHRAIQT
jgi:hypothetical protein